MAPTPHAKWFTWHWFPHQVPNHMWCPTVLEVNGKEMQFPLPEADMTLNFTNSTGLRYEAEEVRRCLQKGNKLLTCIQIKQIAVAFHNLICQNLLVTSLVLSLCVPACSPPGLKESPGMPWAHSSLIAEVIDEARRQLGVTYDQDSIQWSTPVSQHAEWRTLNQISCWIQGTWYYYGCLSEAWTFFCVCACVQIVISATAEPLNQKMYY